MGSPTPEVGWGLGDALLALPRDPGGTRRPEPRQQGLSVAPRFPAGPDRTAAAEL